MSYTVLMERQAEKELRNLPPQMLIRIDSHLLELAEDPRPRGAIKLKGKEAKGWRTKVGSYRILYVVNDTAKVSLSLPH
ncbi:MAG: type II toxin-antitoxin system RelE/ParE family toxin [Chloroflexi bacterium]|nr:type II toxin-antitoxin system RelE/ParE family toxin [Chloroflexota bacterium]